MASVGEKLLPGLALVPPVAVSLSLLAMRNHYYEDSLYHFVQDSRSAVQVIVQILSLILAMLQLYTLRKLFALGTRLLLPGHPLSLETLSLWSAISQTKLDRTLPMSYSLPTALLVCLTTLPSALWAGALTPILDIDSHVNGTIAVPQFSSRSKSVWASQFQVRPHYNNDTKEYDIQIWNILDNCTEIHDLRGFVPSCPVPALQGPLLTSASSATVKTADDSRLHSKLDSVSWAYSGRSYGVGSSAGIIGTSFHTDSTALVAYTYQEAGYRAHVECLKNASSDITLALLETNELGSTWYTLSGALPNEPLGTVEYYPLASLNDHPSLLTWAARSYEGNNIVAIAASEKTFSHFNQTQCSITFTPTIYDVLVNATSRTVQVEQAETGTDVEDLEPTGDLIFSTVQSLNLLARMSNSFYTSVMGNALQSNVYNMETQLGMDAAQDNSVLLAAVEDSFTAIIDDILVAYGASQLLNAHDTIETAVAGQKRAVRVGKHIWIYIALAFNGLLVLAFLSELIRTRFWNGLSRFDYTNIKCAITAASAGGMGIADQIARSDGQSKQDGDFNVQPWDGSPSDPAFEKAIVVLDEGSAASAAKGYSGTGIPTLRSANASQALASPSMVLTSRGLFPQDSSSKSDGDGDGNGRSRPNLLDSY